MMHCPKCGKEAPEENAYCTSCGSPLRTTGKAWLSTVLWPLVTIVSLILFSPQLDKAYSWKLFCFIAFLNALCAIIRIVAIRKKKGAPMQERRSILGPVLSLLLALLFVLSLAGGSTNYRVKAFNAAAAADIRNARTCLEAYHDRHKEYPATLEQSGCNQWSRNVKGTYAGSDKDKYQMTSAYDDFGNYPGTKEFMITSNDPVVYWRYKDDPAGTWKKE